MDKDNNVKSFRNRSKQNKYSAYLGPAMRTKATTSGRHSRSLSAEEFKQNIPRGIANNEHSEKLNAVVKRQITRSKSTSSSSIPNPITRFPAAADNASDNTSGAANPEEAEVQVSNLSGEAKLTTSFSPDRENDNNVYVDKMVDHEISTRAADLQASSILSRLPSIPENSSSTFEEEDSIEAVAGHGNGEKISASQGMRIWRTEYEEFHVDLSNGKSSGLHSPTRAGDDGTDNLFEISLSFRDHGLSLASTTSKSELDSFCDAADDSVTYASTSASVGAASSKMLSSNIYDRSLSSGTSGFDSPNPLRSPSPSPSPGEGIIAELERLRLQVANLHLNYSLAFSEGGVNARNVESPQPTSSAGVLRCRKYSVQEIENATQKFANKHQLGEGNFGAVYQGTLDFTTVAVKIIRDADTRDNRFQREVEMLWMVRHPNIVMLLGACPEAACIVYEYMANGNLAERLSCKNSTSPIPWFLRFKIAWEIATGLLFLHNHKPEPIVHRDLKPSNILLDGNFVSKIGSVALARLIPNNGMTNATLYKNTSVQGTFSYIDPEYQRTGVLCTKSDLYAFGIVLLQLLTAKSPEGLIHAVEKALRKGNVPEILDYRIKDWPIAETVKLVSIALKCCSLRRKDRPDLGTVVLPQLLELKAFADKYVELRRAAKGKILMKFLRLFSRKSQR